MWGVGGQNHLAISGSFLQVAFVAGNAGIHADSDKDSLPCMSLVEHTMCFMVMGLDAQALA